MSDSSIPGNVPPPTPPVIQTDATLEAQSDAAREGVAHRAPVAQAPVDARLEGQPLTNEIRLDRVAQPDESGQTRREGHDRGQHHSPVIEALIDKAGFRRATDGTLQILDQVILHELEELTPRYLTKPGLLAKAMATMSSMGPPPVAPQAVNGPALESFMANLSRGVDDVVRQTNGAPRMIDVIASESLTAAFLKLNILDPNESLEMQNQLDEALTVLQQQMIHNMRKKLDELFKQLEEALASAMSSLFMGAIIAAIIAAVVAAILISIVAAIIVAVVIMVVMQMVISAIKAQAQAQMRQARAEAERQAEQMEGMIKDQIAKIREEEMRKIQEATPVGADGQPLTEDEIRARLEPRLALALMEVTHLFDSDGAEAAKDQGPQIIHDAMYDELIQMGLSPENADGAAWAIAAETMENLAAKLGVDADETGDQPPVGTTVTSPGGTVDENRHPGEALGGEATNDPNAGETLVVDTLPPAGDGRHPADLLGGLGGMLASLGVDQETIEALANSAVVKEAEQRLVPQITPDMAEHLSDSIATQGIAATLQNEVLKERTIAPSAFLGLSAVLSGSVENDAELKNYDLQALVGHVAQSKDQALAALAQVGSESAEADFQLRNPSHI